MDHVLFIIMIPVMVGGLTIYVKLHNIWLHVLGLIMFGSGSFY